MLLAREGRSLVSRCESMPANITSNCEYVAVNLSGDRPTHCLWRVLASCLYHSVPAMFSASYRFTHGIRTSAGAPESSPGCDQIFLTNRTLPEPALQDLACPCGIAGLRGERGFGDVRRHVVVGYRPPRMISGSRLRNQTSRRSLQAGRPPERGRLHRDHRLLQLLSFLTAGSFPAVKPLRRCRA